MHGKPLNKWIAQGRKNNKTLYLGMFDSAEEAAIARDIFAIKDRGQFANTNFPKENYLEKIK